MKKIILPLILVFLIGTFVFAKMLSRNVSKETEAEKDLLESIQLVDMNGNDYTFSRGKNIYIKFWASWCPTCLAGLEELDRLAGENNSNFEVITVVFPGINGEKNPAKFKEWYDSLGYKNIKVLYDTDGKLLQIFKIRALPTSAIIYKDLKIDNIIVGHISNGQIKDYYEGKGENEVMEESKNTTVNNVNQ